MIESQLIVAVIFTLIGGFVLSRLRRKFLDIPIWHQYTPYYNIVPLLIFIFAFGKTIPEDDGDIKV